MLIIQPSYTKLLYNDSIKPLEVNMKRLTAALLTFCLLLSVTACRNGTKSTTVNTAAPTNVTEVSATEHPEEAFEKVELLSESGASFMFTYDSDIIAYTGQGGKFYLVGSDATKCFLHINIQDNADFENAKTTYQSSVSKEFKTESGKAAFVYTTDNAAKYHIIIGTEKGILNIYVGASSEWPYSEEQIANIVDQGLAG